jgi:hypothetical protein
MWVLHAAWTGRRRHNEQYGWRGKMEREKESAMNTLGKLSRKCGV